jgi:hypothetical protein
MFRHISEPWPNDGVMEMETRIRVRTGLRESALPLSGKKELLLDLTHRACGARHASVEANHNTHAGRCLHSVSVKLQWVSTTMHQASSLSGKWRLARATHVASHQLRGRRGSIR